MAEKSNMYKLSVFQWSPFVGCKFDCVYCRKSFQAQAKRQKHRCMKCYNYEPHEHPERLAQSLPKTGYMQFIFTCSMGDISFCSTEYLKRIVWRMKNEPDKTFLIQSKNPKTFGRVKWPNNVILGTTIETNDDEMYEEEAISKAPLPTDRWAGLAKIKHPHKMITIEPVLAFISAEKANNLMKLKDINPCMVWLGYNSRKNNLPEPPIEKFKQLHWELSKLGIPVILKNCRQKER